MYISGMVDEQKALEHNLPFLDFRYIENIVAWKRLRRYFKTFNRRKVKALELFMSGILVTDFGSVVVFVFIMYYKPDTRFSARRRAQHQVEMGVLLSFLIFNLVVFNL